MSFRRHRVFPGNRLYCSDNQKQGNKTPHTSYIQKEKQKKTALANKTGQFGELGLVILFILCPVRRTGPSTNLS